MSINIFAEIGKCQLFPSLPGLGHYDATGEPSRVQGDIEGEKVIYMSSKGDCVLAVSGEFIVGHLHNQYSDIIGQLMAYILNHINN